MAGIAYWSVNGVVSFSFLQAFPFETLRSYPRKYVVPGVALLFVLWSGHRYWGGTFRPDDILLLGAVSLLVYRYFRNSLSLVLAYVALFEPPILWCFGVAWNHSVFLAVIYARIVWCGLAVFVLIYRRLVEEEVSLNDIADQESLRGQVGEIFARLIFDFRRGKRPAVLRNTLAIGLYSLEGFSAYIFSVIGFPPPFEFDNSIFTGKETPFHVIHNKRNGIPFYPDNV